MLFSVATTFTAFSAPEGKMKEIQELKFSLKIKPFLFLLFAYATKFRIKLTADLGLVESRSSINWWSK